MDWMRFGNYTGLPFLMSPSILATGNVWDHILVCFWVCPKSTFELLFKRKNIYIHFCSFTGLFVGNFSEMRGCWKALQLWRQLNSSWAGNLPGFSHGGQVLMHGGGRGENGLVRKPVACQACPYNTLEKATPEHSPDCLVPCWMVFTSKNF